MTEGQLQNKGFFAALFDFSFTSFVTLRFLKVIYAVLVALILVGGVVAFFAFLFRGGGSILVALVLVPLGTFLYLVIARVYMEILALFFRIGENTSMIAQQVAGGPSGGGNGHPFSGAPSDGGPYAPSYPGTPPAGGSPA